MHTEGRQKDVKPQGQRDAGEKMSTAPPLQSELDFF